MKKRLLAIMLVAAMIMGMSMTTMAAAGYTDSDPTSFTITKTYTSDETFVPAEELSFDVAVMNGYVNPDDTMITVDNVTVSAAAADKNNITVKVPSYDTAGIYKYTIKEIAGNTQGVTYDTATTIEVAVFVGYDNVNNKLVIEDTTYILKNEAGEKISNFDNKFDTNDFTVAKDVEGNMANETDKFEIVVTLTAEDEILTDIMVGGEKVAPSAWVECVYTKTLNISESDGKVAFTDIPVGVTVNVAETNTAENLKGYTMGDTDNASFTVEEDADVIEVVVNNTKTTTVDTGVIVNNFPFIMALAAAALVAAAFMKKRRSF